jgi:hypothetical protein
VLTCPCCGIWEDRLGLTLTTTIALTPRRLVAGLSVIDPRLNLAAVSTAENNKDIGWIWGTVGRRMAASFTC